MRNKVNANSFRRNCEKKPPPFLLETKRNEPNEMRKGNDEMGTRSRDAAGILNKHN